MVILFLFFKKMQSYTNIKTSIGFVLELHVKFVFTYFIFQNISDEQFSRLFKTLEDNTKLETLCMANVGMSDRLLDSLCAGVSSNNVLKVLK